MSSAHGILAGQTGTFSLVELKPVGLCPTGETVSFVIAARSPRAKRSNLYICEKDCFVGYAFS